MTGSMSKSVRFDQVFIHEFPIILGDNPAVSRGAPLTIDWKPCAHDVIDVDIFEYLREPERRHRKKMIVSNSKRAKILMNAGYTVDEIAEATLAMEEAKKVRAENALEAAKSAEGGGWKNLNILNPNLMLELLSGAAEGTGRTLFLAPNAMLGAANATGQAVGKVGYEVVRGTVKGTGVVVKGTGKVVVGTGKVATDVVMGTGKLGYNVVATTGKVTTDLAVGTVKGTGKVVKGAGKHIGKRMSKMMTFNDSATKDMLKWEEDLGYEDPDSLLELQTPQPRSLYDGRRGSNDSMGRRSRRGSNDSTGRPSRRGSNDSTGRKSRSSSGSKSKRRESSDGASSSSKSGKGSSSNNNNKSTPAPQRMSRRGSANGSVSAQMANYRSSKRSETSPKPNRRSSTSGPLAGSFSNFKDMITGGRGLRRNNSGATRRTKSGDAMPMPSKNSSLMMVTPRGGGGGRGGPTMRGRSKSANAATALGEEGDLSHLEQMEDFLNYVRESDPSKVNPAIGNAYSSNSDLSYDPSNEDLLLSPPDSPTKLPQQPSSPPPSTSEPATPAA